MRVCVGVCARVCARSKLVTYVDLVLTAGLSFGHYSNKHSRANLLLKLLSKLNMIISYDN